MEDIKFWELINQNWIDIRGQKIYFKDIVFKNRKLFEKKDNGEFVWLEFFTAGLQVPESASTKPEQVYVNGGELSENFIFLKTENRVFSTEDIVGFIKDSELEKINKKAKNIDEEKELIEKYRNHTGKKRLELKIQKGDLLISFRQSIKCNIYDMEENAFCNQAVDIVRTKSELLNNLYLYFFISREYRKHAIGDGQDLRLNNPEKEKCEIKIPDAIGDISSVEIQKAIAQLKMEQYELIWLKQKILKQMKLLIDVDLNQRLDDIAAFGYQCQKISLFDVGKGQFIASARRQFTLKDQNTFGKYGFLNIAAMSDELGKVLSEKDLKLFSDEINVNGKIKDPKDVTFLKSHEILVSFKQTIGRVNFYSGTVPTVANEAVDILEIDMNLYDPIFLLPQIKKGYVDNKKANAGSWTLAQDEKNKIEIQIPLQTSTESSLDIQRKISKEFDKINKESLSKIAKLDAMNSLLETIMEELK